MLARELSICAVGMTARDEMLVKSCLNLLGSHTSGVTWRFTESPDCDVAVCDPDSPVAMQMRSRESAAGRPLCVALLDKAGHADDWPCVLRRPIRIGDFRAVLEKAADEAGPAAVPAAPASHGTVGASVLKALQLLQSSSALRPVALRAAGLEVIVDPVTGRCQCDEGFGEAVLQQLATHTSEVQFVDAAAVAHLDEDKSVWLETLLWQLGERVSAEIFPVLNGAPRLRLQRWPDFGKVPPSSRHIQLSALLDKQAYDVVGLAAAAGLQVQEVETFLRASAAIGILNVQAVASTIAPTRLAEEPVVVERRGPLRLFDRLRSALGMRG